MTPPSRPRMLEGVRHLDLFSGIGGFAYAADQVWDNVEHIFCDNDKFCQQVLTKHWPEAKIYGDIQSITDTERKGWWQRPKPQKGQVASPDNRPDLLTGGFPCQPFSAAGVRRGTADDRYLWPEMLRVIQLTKPTWVIAENVRGLLTWNDGLVFEQVCLDLESEGYEVQPFIIPALAVNAPHRRDRVWFVAHRISSRSRGDDGQATNQRRQASQVRSESLQPQDRQTPPDNLKSSNNSAKDPISQRSRGGNESGRQILERQSTEVQDQRPSWQSDWLEIATQFCSVDDGLPVTLDGFKLSKAQNRKEQLKAYGNAIVPQVAIEIMKGMNVMEHITPPSRDSKTPEGSKE